MDDGQNGPISNEVNTNNDPLVRGLPSLNTLVVTNFPANSDGDTFRFQIEVFTTQRSGLSDVGFITKASVPGKPLDVPVSDPTVTSDTQIKVNFANPAPDNGGSPIISYEL